MSNIHFSQVESTRSQIPVGPMSYLVGKALFLEFLPIMLGEK